MRIEFLGQDSPGRAEVQDHIRAVYRDAYCADVQDYAPLLVAAKRADGAIMCAAGIRTSRDRFFSTCYLDGDFETVLRDMTGVVVPKAEIMEVVSLASTTPFPVLAMLDGMIRWGRENGMTCGVFTATSALRRLLDRSGMAYAALAPAQANRVNQPEAWGSYYDTHPWVCAFRDNVSGPITLSPRLRACDLRSEAV